MALDPSGDRPKARDDDLVVERVGDELLIYDLERDKAHCLNATAALVFDHCDGERSIRQLAAELALDEHVVHATLVRLSDARLLEEPVYVRVDGQWSRRQALRRIGVAGAAAGLGLPVVRSIAAPTAAQAQASPCIPRGEECGRSVNAPCDEQPLPCCDGRACSPTSIVSGVCVCV